MKTYLNLQEFASSLDNALPFMEGREKGNTTDIIGSHVTIVDFGFMHDKKKDEDYACFIIKEDADKFYFGGKVVTDHMQKLDDAGWKGAVQNEGLPVMFNTVTPEKGNAYTGVKYYPKK